MSLQSRLAALISAMKADHNDTTDRANTIVYPLGGQFLLDPNEFNGWGVIGPYDNTNSQDLGNVGIANPSRIAGGICFPFDVRLNRFYAWHQENNNAVLPWGWRIGFQTKNDASNTVAWTDLLNEVADNGGIGPNNYLSTQTMLTDIDLSGGPVIPAGDTIVLGVEAPTAVTTNLYIRVMSGYFELTRV